MLWRRFLHGRIWLSMLHLEPCLYTCPTRGVCRREYPFLDLSQFSQEGSWPPLHQAAIRNIDKLTRQNEVHQREVVMPLQRLQRCLLSGAVVVRRKDHPRRPGDQGRPVCGLAWSAQYYSSSGNGATNCGFVSYEQCMMTATPGSGAWCVRNTWAVPYGSGQNAGNARRARR
jgi:hypothetical protein